MKLILGDAMRTTMTSSSECFTSSYVYEIFSDDEIHYLYDLMRYVHKFYQFIGSQDRTKDSFFSSLILVSYSWVWPKYSGLFLDKNQYKPQAIRAAGGFLQVAPDTTPLDVISSLVDLLSDAMRAKNAKLAWNGAKSCEYFLSNQSTAWLDPSWTDKLYRSLSFAMKNNKNNKVKINCLMALSQTHVQEGLTKAIE